MPVEPIGLLALLFVGAIAGWLAGKLVHGYGFGLIGNIAVGIIGAVIGVWLLTTLNIRIGTGLVSWIIDATLGAVLLLVIVGLIKR